MTIEQRLLADLGATTVPSFAVWLLKDGTLVNGSHEGYQRDIDHHEIGQYFKHSKYHVPGSSTLYLRKFMRRGNIRISCSDCGLCAEYAVTPSDEQMEILTKIAIDCIENHMQTAIGHYKKDQNTDYMNFYAFIEHLLRYTDVKIPSEALELL